MPHKDILGAVQAAGVARRAQRDLEAAALDGHGRAHHIQRAAHAHAYARARLAHAMEGKIGGGAHLSTRSPSTLNRMLLAVEAMRRLVLLTFLLRDLKGGSFR